MSAFKTDVVDTKIKACDFKYIKVEDQKEVWEDAMRIGRVMGERLK